MHGALGFDGARGHRCFRLCAVRLRIEILLDGCVVLARLIVVLSWSGHVCQLVTPLQEVIPSNVVKPHYKRPGDGRFMDYYICHMGVGGFHR